MKVIGVNTGFRQITHNLQERSLPTGPTVEAYLIAANEDRESEQTGMVSAVVARSTISHLNATTYNTQPTPPI